MGKYYVYNTITSRYEFVELPEPVYSELKRWDWRQEKQETAAHRHEIVASELHGDYEDFHEFADEIDVADDAVKLIMLQRLRICMNNLTEEERELISALFFFGMTEREYGKIHGISQKNVNKKKRRILCKLYKLFVGD